MQTIYCLSGLGADERIFKNLDIKGARLQYLPWVAWDKHDELPCYAQKMAAQIPEKDPIILGISFGGMLATEIAKQVPVKQTFLISSAKGRQELPEVGSSLKFLVKNNLMPYSLFKRPNSILFDRFGAATPEDKAMLTAIMHDTDTGFLGWAFKAIIDWQNTTVPPNIIHIHGTADKIIQPNYVQANYWLRGGTHMMIFNRASEVSALVAGNLSA